MLAADYLRTVRRVRRVMWVPFAALLAGVVVSEIVAVFDYTRSIDWDTDFQGTIWQPARNVLDGTTPYPDLAAVEYRVGVYPPSAFLPMLPLAALPLLVATSIFVALLFVASMLTLAVLGVRDWRCYALWLTSALVILPVQGGNATVLVVLCAALVWRYRDSAIAAGCALAVAVAIKLFLAPLVVWLVFTRRLRAAVYAVLATAFAILGSWAVIAFDGLLAFPSRLREVAEHWGASGALVQAFGRQSGLSYEQGLALGVVIGLGLLVGAWYVRENDLASFTLSAAGALSFTPIGWPFYAAILVVPLAVVHPRFSAAWLVLPLFWIHWWHSPIAYKSPELSAVTLILAGLLCTPAHQRTPKKSIGR